MTPVDGEQVRQSLAAKGEKPSAQNIAHAIRSSGFVYGPSEMLEKISTIQSELAGFGRLQEILDDKEVTDVFVNGKHGVYLDRGNGLEESSVEFTDDAEVRALAVRLAAAGGRRLDDAHPFVDMRLGGGIRGHAVLHPVSPTGTLISLRIPRRRTFSLDEITEAGMLVPEVKGVIEALIACRANFLISGGTGSGKTTLLSTLLGLISKEERLILVEDTVELSPDHTHTLHLECRAGNVEGTGAIGLTELVRNALRMRPDRLVIGECRGAEVRELLNALNTGHSGGCATLHANTAQDVPARLEALGMLAGLTRSAVAVQGLSAIDVVLHVGKRHGRRTLLEIGVVQSHPIDTWQVLRAVRCDGDSAYRGVGWLTLCQHLDLDPKDSSWNGLIEECGGEQ